jgi:hypothetical protein
MIRKFLLASVGAIALTGSAALAAEPPPAPPPVYLPPPFTWTGVYVGGQIGYAWGTGTNQFTGFDPFFLGGVAFTNNVGGTPNGVIGGAQCRLSVIHQPRSRAQHHPDRAHGVAVHGRRGDRGADHCRDSRCSFPPILATTTDVDLLPRRQNDGHCPCWRARDRRWARIGAPRYVAAGSGRRPAGSSPLDPMKETPQ